MSQGEVSAGWLVAALPSYNPPKEPFVICDEG